VLFTPVENLPLVLLYRWQFSTGIIDPGSKFAPVSTTLAKLVAKFTTGVVDTGGKFVSLIPVVHLDF
jgi:hypothetical protein